MFYWGQMETAEVFRNKESSPILPTRSVCEKAII